MNLYQIRSELSSGKTIFDIPMRVTFYARVSTDKEEQRHSLNNQIHYYKDYILDCPLWTYVDGYVDEGLSGTSVNKRVSFLQMMEDAQKGLFDFIVTKEISRFSRNTLDSIQYTQSLLAAGVGILFQSDNINTLYPDAELRLTIMSSIAQDEVRKISERVKFGFKRAIENGVVLGSNKIWGYRKDHGRLVIDENEAQVVRLIFDLYANENMGIRAICGSLTEMGYKNNNGNPFSFSTVRGILANPKYKGFYCGGKTHKYDYKLKQVQYIEASQWVMYPDAENVPPIVSEQLWEKANGILASRSKKMAASDKTSYQNKYVYSGKIICGVHQKPYYRTLFRYKSGNKEAWACREYTQKGKSGCANPVVYTDELNLVIHELQQQLIQDTSSLTNQMIRIYEKIAKEKKDKSPINRLSMQADYIKEESQKLLSLCTKGYISDEEFRSRNDRLKADLQQTQQALAQLSLKEKETPPIESLPQVLEAVFTAPPITNQIVDALIQQITVTGVNKNIIQLQVQLRSKTKPLLYEIRRNKNSPSVCSVPYI